MSENRESSEVLTAANVSAPNPDITIAGSELASKLERERKLIVRICAGEKDLFYELMRPYERAVFLAANSILQNEHDAEEAAQEAVLKAFIHLDRFRGDARFSTWLIQIVINEARMKRRKERKHLYDSIDEPKTDDESDYKPQDLADWREIPSEALQQQELREALRKAIASLAPIYRQVFMLRDVQQMSIAETSAALGITEASVKTRLLRARLQVRDSLAPGYDGRWAIGDGHWNKVRPW
jgi:RNA polymerase sigma-70 factor, ECF subfamily